MEKVLQRKVLDIVDMKIEEKDGNLYISGYANTKNSEDRYGDIPTVFTPLRNFVYDMTEFKKNPVMLVNHVNKVENIAGSYIEFREDERGLYVVGKFSNSDFPLIKHARTVYQEGHGKAFSISGYFYWEDKDNPQHLTLVELFEISLVAIGADPNALGNAEMKNFKERQIHTPAPEPVKEAQEENKTIKLVGTEIAKQAELAGEILQSLTT